MTHAFDRRMSWARGGQSQVGTSSTRAVIAAAIPTVHPRQGVRRRSSTAPTDHSAAIKQATTVPSEARPNASTRRSATGAEQEQHHRHHGLLSLHRTRDGRRQELRRLARAWLRRRGSEEQTDLVAPARRPSELTPKIKVGTAQRPQRIPTHQRHLRRGGALEKRSSPAHRDFPGHASSGLLAYRGRHRLECSALRSEQTQTDGMYRGLQAGGRGRACRDAALPMLLLDDSCNLIWDLLPARRGAAHCADENRISRCRRGRRI